MKGRIVPKDTKRQNDVQSAIGTLLNITFPGILLSPEAGPHPFIKKEHIGGKYAFQASLLLNSKQSAYERLLGK